MSTRSRWNAGALELYDGPTALSPGQLFETVWTTAPVWFASDFAGAGASIPGAATAGQPWMKKIAGAAPPTVGSLANAAGGQVACALTATNEKQDAALYFGDQLTFDATKLLLWEARVNLSVLPSAAGVQTVFGLSSAWIDGPDNASFYLEFGATANGAILVRSKDGVNTFSLASGVTVAAGDFHVYRIDATDPTDVKFYIDGEQVTKTGAVTFAATGANAILQPYVSVYKPSGTGVATTVVDVVKIHGSR